MPAHQLGGKNECATAAEEAARVALARGVFREGLTLELSRAAKRRRLERIVRHYLPTTLVISPFT